MPTVLSVYWKGFSPEKRKAFDRQLMMAIDDSGYYNSLPDYMQDAVDSMAAQFKQALELQREAGVSGFANLKYDKHYVPKVLNQMAIVRAASKHGREKVVRVMAKAYMEGGFKLKPKTAKVLAEMNYARLASNLGPDASIIPKGVSKDALVREMRESGMDDDTIRSFLESREDADYKDMISARAKRSVRPRLASGEDGLHYIDLIDNRVENVIESYAREASGNIGMARVLGIGSYQKAQAVVDIEFKNAVNDNPEMAIRLEEEAEMLKQGIDLIYGKNLETENLGAVQNLSRLKQITRILMLPMNGLTSMPELVRPIMYNGIMTSLRHLPSCTKAAFQRMPKEGARGAGCYPA